MSPYVENSRRERFQGIPKIPNYCRDKFLRDFQETEHNTMAKVDQPKAVITRFIISKLIFNE